MADRMKWSTSLEAPVPSGDYFDTAEEDGLRIAGDVPIVDVLGGATVIKALDGGAGDIGDGVTATGSTAAASFTAAYTASPVVVAIQDIIRGADTAEGASFVGSRAVALAGLSVGSAVFYGVSGTGFNWLAYGDKY